MKHELLVSIITPILNGEKYLEGCIVSVLNQDYKNIEHIFVDGMSKDKTLAILKKFHSRYPHRIRFISGKINAEDAWVEGLKLAKGDVFGWLGVDDVYETGAIRAVVNFFKSNTKASVVFGGSNVVDQNGNLMRKATTKDFTTQELLAGMGYIALPALFFKREVFEKIGLPDTSIHACDFDYIIRISKAYKIHRLDKVLANFRKHARSTSGSPKAGMMYAKERLYVCRKHNVSFMQSNFNYLKSIIIELLRPVFGKFYPLLDEKILRSDWKKPVKVNSDD
jgi:glycosyltransferase involved in cell wall biosynthesis